MRFIPVLYGKSGAGVSESAVRQKDGADEDIAIPVCRVYEVLSEF